MVIDSKIDKMLTLKEAARFLHVHPNTLRRWEKKGIIDSIRITSRGDRRFMKRDVFDFLAEMRNQNR